MFEAHSLKKICSLSVITLSLLVSGGCATSIKGPVTAPKPPSQRFGTYQRVELAPIEVASAIPDSANNQQAISKIKMALLSSLSDVLPTLKRVKSFSSAANPKAVSTLVIRPTIEKMKFVRVRKRILTGPMSGSSAVLMRVTYLDKATGKVIAEPEFYQKASAWGAAWSFGSSDNSMLTRVANVIGDYTRQYS